MHKKINRLYKLALLGLVTFAGFENSVQAQACIPVVYAFRHAEDFTPKSLPTGGPYGFLIRAGAAHAELYPAMITALRTAKGYCPVTKVYAASSTNDTNGNINYNGAVNSFCTARPLAEKLNPLQSWTIPYNNEKSSQNPLCVNATTGMVEGPLASSKDPTISNGPIMFIGSVVLDQSLKANNFAGGIALSTALLANAKTTPTPGSSAIFWTSEGLHNLGNAIINNGRQGPIPSNVPIKANGAPGRNAVYIFTLKDDATGFNDASNNYFQCFNFTNTTSGKIATMQTNNWCGATTTSGAILGYSLPSNGTCSLDDLKNDGAKCLNQVPIANLPNGNGTQINGKICKVSGSNITITPSSLYGNNYTGYCTP